MARKMSVEMNNYFWFRGQATFVWLVQAVPALTGCDSQAWKSWAPLLPVLSLEEVQGPPPQSTACTGLRTHDKCLPVLSPWPLQGRGDSERPPAERRPPAISSPLGPKEQEGSPGEAEMNCWFVCNCFDFFVFPKRKHSAPIPGEAERTETEGYFWSSASSKGRVWTAQKESSPSFLEWSPWAASAVWN